MQESDKQHCNTFTPSIVGDKVNIILIKTQK